ncbi:aminotransferase class V-fold PLP-dependent enzyme [candidate division KSB1 bacterium]
MKNSSTLLKSYPEAEESMYRLPRRDFMKRMLAGATAAAALPYVACGESVPDAEPLESFTGSLAAGDPGDERFWQKVKAQFPLRENLIMLNAANLCPSSLPVQQCLFDYTWDINGDASSVNRRKFSETRENTRTALAEFLGAGPEEIAITRNTSESNNIVINGIHYEPGDEIVIWDQNHPTNNVAWDVRAERFGFKVIKVGTPDVPRSPEDLMKPFTDVITRRTKVLAFSHVSNVSGVGLPAKELCSYARERNILSLVDGAQTFGAHALDLHDMGCDFYTGSSHKWPCGPKEEGVLYVRHDLIEGMYPSMVGVGWEGAVSSGNAVKFEVLGQQDDPRIAAFGKTFEFHSAIGIERIEKRVRALADAVKSELKRLIPGVTIHTPVEHEMSGGVVIFAPPGIDQRAATGTLYNDYDIGCAVMGGGTPGIRFSPHIYNTMEEIERAVAAVASLV